MDKELITEWLALKKLHDDAHYRYLHVHSVLTDRMMAAIKGSRWPSPMAAEVEAHEAATERWQAAKQKLQAFCRTHEDVC